MAADLTPALDLPVSADVSADAGAGVDASADTGSDATSPVDTLPAPDTVPAGCGYQYLVNSNGYTLANLVNAELAKGWSVRSFHYGGSSRVAWLEKPCS